MAESALTPPAAPNGGTAYAETKLIFECELAEITTFSPDDFFVRKGADFASKGVQGYW